MEVNFPLHACVRGVSRKEMSESDRKEPNPKRKRTPLIQNAAFLKVTLEDLQTEINSQGCVDTYQNGTAQSGKKASAEISAYNTSLKNYTTIIEKLDKMLPPEQKKSKLDAFTNDE